MEPWVIPVIIFSVFLCIMLLFAALSRCASVGSSNIGGGGAAAGHHRFGRDHVNIDIGGSGDAGYSSWGGGGGGGGGGCDSGGAGGGGGGC
ncbi:hypothetical protein ES319_D04G143800v1 [Gossypium barbadense]|uniref:Uncharacterized protein n=3 Tax=Gossypium TaxID=3633 RepID=A0A5J5S053_GOSBA|nr:hypothetical protein ES319_D04G143800v1 [Gossypium barbadense]TYG74071.1 hypothetical protein ES288_D04G153400v1 [Gossypium darwinii]TYH77444.1 hypothetical protein ES332_D04G155200v1 [Gossypium tomentosum]